MTETEKKALALVNEACKSDFKDLGSTYRNNLLDALCRAIEQHEAFRQEVSNAIVDCGAERYLGRFIIAEPDPLVEALKAIGASWPEAIDRFRTALAARGLKIVEDK